MRSFSILLFADAACLACAGKTHGKISQRLVNVYGTFPQAPNQVQWPWRWSLSVGIGLNQILKMEWKSKNFLWDNSIYWQWIAALNNWFEFVTVCVNICRKMNATNGNCCCKWEFRTGENEFRCCRSHLNVDENRNYVVRQPEWTWICPVVVGNN